MIRVAVTTDRFGAVAAVYRAVGLEPVSTPCVRQETAPEAAVLQAREEAGTSGLLMVGSARVIDVLWPKGGMPPVDVAAVGPSTARAIAAAGGRVVVVGDAGLAELVDRCAPILRERRVMLAHAAGSDSDAMRSLRALAGSLRDHVIYEMVPVGPPQVTVDAVAFASPSAVAGWHLTLSLDGLVVGAIGETTAAAVSAHRPPDVVAASPSHAALAAAIARYVEVSV